MDVGTKSVSVLELPTKGDQIDARTTPMSPPTVAFFGTRRGPIGSCWVRIENRALASKIDVTTAVTTFAAEMVDIAAIARNFAGILE